MTARMLAAVLVLAVAACDGKPAPPPATAAKAPAPAAPALPPGADAKADGPKGLGGGYREAKWGASMEQVEKLLGVPEKRGVDPADPTHQFVVFPMKEASGQESRKQLIAYFLNGELFRVALLPHFSDTNRAGYDTLKDALEAKFGAGKKLDDPTADVYAWDDGTTRIEFGVALLDDKAAVDQKLGDRHAYATTSVVYTSVERAQRLATKPEPAVAPVPEGAGTKAIPK